MLPATPEAYLAAGTVCSLPAIPWLERPPSWAVQRCTTPQGRCKLTCCGQEPEGGPYNPGLLAGQGEHRAREGGWAGVALLLFRVLFFFSFLNIYLTVSGLSCSPWDQVLGFCFSFSNPASRWLSGKEHACQYGGDSDSIPGSGRSSRGGNDNPLQYSCLGNSRDRRAQWATVQGVAKSRT